MKKLFILFFIISFSTLFTQGRDKSTLFSSFDLGILGGINFSTLSSSGSSLIVEGKTNLTPSLNIKLSLGYSRSYLLNFYQVKTYRFYNIQGIEGYETISYNVIKKGYDVIPISVGLQYIFNRTIFSPYTLLEFGYNSIGTKIYTSQIYSRAYNSFDELPNDYRNKYIEKLVNSSYRLGLGLGLMYRLSSALNLDVRYLYQLDSEIINTHQLLLGVTF